MTITKEEFNELSNKFSIFKSIGFDNFEPKIWLIFVALRSGKISETIVASKPCQSLMENNVPFEQIKQFLNDIHNGGIFYQIPPAGSFAVTPEIAYELHRVIYQMTKNLEKSKTALLDIIHQCGYMINTENREHVKKFSRGDDNAKSDVMKDLLSQLAYAGTRLLIKGILRIEEKLD